MKFIMPAVVALFLVGSVPAVAATFAPAPSPLDRIADLRLAQATLEGTGTGASALAACRAARASAELACNFIGREGDARAACSCTPVAGGFSCTVVAECIPKW